MEPHEIVVTIRARLKGYSVETSNGDVSWQPSREFAESFARRWIKDNAPLGGVIRWGAER